MGIEDQIKKKDIIVTVEDRKKVSILVKEIIDSLEESKDYEGFSGLKGKIINRLSDLVSMEKALLILSEIEEKVEEMQNKTLEKNQ